MPPIIIFPRVKKQSKYLQGAPDGAIIEFHQSGYMQKEIFSKWMTEFIKFSKPKADKKVLLLLDNHSTHVNNLGALELAKDNNIIMLTFPPHTSHRLQPVDITFNKPLSTFFAEEHNTWMRAKKKEGKVVTLADFFSVWTPAYIRAASLSNARNGFRKAGVHPFNRNVFSNEEFTSSRPEETIGKYAIIF